MERKQTRSKTSKVKARNNKGTEKVEEKLKEVPLKDRKKIIKDERNEEKSLIGINGGQENKKKEKTYINSATV